MYEHKKEDIFEGIEKRINIQLNRNFFEDKKIKSLLEISDDIWKKKLNCVGCNIISKIYEYDSNTNEETCRAFLLSESSLFVYEDKLFLKTCGKTKVLFFIPILIDSLLKEITGVQILPENCIYDETFLHTYDLRDLIEYANSSVEYVLFTHLNYQNCSKKNVFNQEYPHRSMKEENEFFSFFFPNMQYVETALSVEKTHYVFYSRLNHSFPSINQTFCSEIVLFQIRNEQEKEKLREFYLNEGVLHLFHNHQRKQLSHSDQDDLKTEDCCNEYADRKFREQTLEEDPLVESYEKSNECVGNVVMSEEVHMKKIDVQELVDMEETQNNSTTASTATSTMTCSTTASATASSIISITEKEFYGSPSSLENKRTNRMVHDSMDSTSSSVCNDRFAKGVELFNDKELSSSSSKDCMITQIDDNIFTFSQKNGGYFLYNEFHFTPCGYSCNIINQKEDYICVHYSPEESVSYVSVELKSNLNMNSFTKFMKQQLTFYQGKYLYIMNYESAFERKDFMQHTIEEENSIEEKSSNDESESDVTKICSDYSSDSNPFINEMNQRLVLNGNVCYQLCTYKERIIDFMKIKYFVYKYSKKKSEEYFTITTPITLEPCCDISNTGKKEKEKKHSHEQFRRMCYQKALDFCMNHKVYICDEQAVYRNEKESWKQVDEGHKNVELILENYKEINQGDKLHAQQQIKEKNQHEIQILHKILHDNIETSMMCINLEKILRQYIRFKKNFPNVTPFYSMKSNNDATIIKLLNELGCNFDCASVGEIKKLLKILPWLPTERIIFANTIKSINSLMFAKSKNVNLVTFDNIDELKKIAAYHSKCNLLLRINVDFKNKKSYMSNKYGAYKHEWMTLFKYAKSENLKIIGVSFHVGSNTKHLEYYCEAIRLSKEAWVMAKTIGFNFEILNMGGGYPEELEYDHEKNISGKYCTMSNEELREAIESLLKETTDRNSTNTTTVGQKSLSSLGVEFTFEQIAVAINTSIDSFFKKEKEYMRIICEPGRFLVASSTILAVKVIGKRNPMMREKTPLVENEMNNRITQDTHTNNSNTSTQQKTSFCTDEGNVEGIMETEGEENENEPLIDSVHIFNEVNKKLGSITNIKKEIVNVKNHRNQYYSYYVNESIYGCFSNIIFDEYRRTPFCIIRTNLKQEEGESNQTTNRGFNNASNNTENKNTNATCVYRTSIFGQSCDGLDMINSQVYLPECNINDWLLYDYTGAYSYVSSSRFNGFRKSQKFYIFPPERF